MRDLRVVSYYGTYLEGKKYQTWYIDYVSKNLHKMTYLIRGFLAFGSNDQCYGYNQGIVCDNMVILCIHVHHGMANNVARGSFPFCRTKKAFSIFRA